jgi:hypothetical protein
VRSCTRFNDPAASWIKVAFICSAGPQEEAQVPAKGTVSNQLPRNMGAGAVPGTDIGTTIIDKD